MGPIAFFSFLLVIAAIFITVFLFIKRYKRVPPNKFMVVFGRGKDLSGAEVITSGAKMIWPVIREAAYMSLHPWNIDFIVENAPTKTAAPLSVNGVAQIRIRPEKDSMLTMAQLYLSREEQIPGDIKEILEAKVRELLSTLSIEEITYEKRENFQQNVQEVVSESLVQLGLQVVNLGIKEFRDPNDYLKSLSVQQIAEVRKNATIYQAEADREAVQKSAEAKRIAQTAQAVADTQVAEAEKNRDVQKAQFAQAVQMEKAQADMAYKLQEAKTQRDVTTAEKDVELAAAHKNIEIQEKKIILQERTLDTDIRKPAEAKRHATEQESEAKKYATEREAEASAFRRQAEARAEADATRLKGQAEADIIIQKGQAEAQAKKALLMAEAEGLRAKAEALAMMNEAGKLQMMLDALPKVVGAMSEPLSKIDKVVVIDSGDSSSAGGVTKFFKSCVNTLPQINETLKATTGIDLMQLYSEGLQRQAAAAGESAPVQKKGEDNSSAGR